jgi:hypothetical protein
MEDYQIKSDGRSFFGVSAQTERAQSRAAGPPLKSNLTVVFRTRTEIVEFVSVGEAQGFTFAGKESLGA